MAKEVFDLWYNERQVYDYNTPGFSMQTGHFSQVVWQSSERLGCSIECNQATGKCFSICSYDPPGNVIGAFEQNVLPINKMLFE